MIYFVDIDGTICTHEVDYEKAKPLMDKIFEVNKLYDAGHRVVYWTARGTGTGIDWETVTNKQLDSWGAKRHSIRFGKPVYDILYDDRARNI